MENYRIGLGTDRHRLSSDRPLILGGVEIPSGPDGHGAQGVRRLLLDGMREGSPAGHEAAVRRYYEGLLR